MFDKWWIFLKYLGPVIFQDQVTIDSIKVVRVFNWPTLYNHTNMQVFLEFTNFYHKFTYSFSDIVYSL